MRTEKDKEQGDLMDERGSVEGRQAVGDNRKKKKNRKKEKKRRTSRRCYSTGSDLLFRDTTARMHVLFVSRFQLLILTAKSEMARIPWARLIRPWASHRDVTQGWPDVAL